MKKRIVQVVIVLIFMFSLLFIAKNQSSFSLIESSRETTGFSLPSSTAYFVVSTPKGEYIISGLTDIDTIYNKLNFASYSYEYEGEFDYNMILSCVNISKLSESNLLIKDNYILNGNRVFELNFNIENYLYQIAKNYD